MRTKDIPEPIAEIGIPRDVLAYIVLKARAYDAETPAVDPDDSSNDADDRAVDVLEESPDNTNAREIVAAVRSLPRDAQDALVALVWVGRGDYSAEEWRDALQAAAARSEAPTPRYLLGIPLLGDLIEEGAAALGISLTEEEVEALSNPSTV